MEFIEKLFSSNGIELPEYMKAHLQTKSNYSYSNFAKKIRMIIRDKLHRDGLSFDEINSQIDSELEEAFISMSMLKPMTTLSKMGVKNPRLIKAVEESMADKDVVIPFIKENASKFDDFTEFKHSLTTELADSRENRQDRRDLAQLQSRLVELNSELRIKLQDKQAV